MTDVVSVQKLLDDRRNLIVKLTNLSDGTGETNVRKIDVSTLNPPNPGAHLKLWECQYDIRNMGVRLQWEGAPNADILVLGGLGSPMGAFCVFGGIWNNADDASGNVSLTTIGAMPGASYTFVLSFKKAA